MFLDLHDDRFSHAIIKCIITLGEELGYTIVAEGIEQQDQLDFLKEIGCDMYQGYLVAQPMPASELVDFLREHKANNK